MSVTLRCPRCSFFLKQEHIKGHEVDHCFRCGGTFLEKGSESKILGQSSSTDYWRGTELGKRQSEGDIACLHDDSLLVPYFVSFQDRSVEVDVCSKCEGLWLDPAEGKKLLDIVLYAGQHKQTPFNEKPGFKSYLFQAFSGMPVEAWNPVHHRPMVTLALMVSLVLFYFCQQGFPIFNEVLILFPQQFIEGEQVWSVLSSGFLHSSLAHLLGNLYFLYIFGDNVEDFLGRFRFAALYLSAIVFSSLAYILATLGSSTGVLGASGAIAALMGAYLVLFPKVKLHFTILFIPFQLGAFWYLSFWLLLNVLMMFLALGNVAWSSHIGGFLFGLAAGYGYRFTSIKNHIQGA